MAAGKACKAVSCPAEERKLVFNAESVMADTSGPSHVEENAPQMTML